MIPYIVPYPTVYIFEVNVCKQSRKQTGYQLIDSTPLVGRDEGSLLNINKILTNIEVDRESSIVHSLEEAKVGPELRSS